MFRSMDELIEIWRRQKQARRRELGLLPPCGCDGRDLNDDGRWELLVEFVPAHFRVRSIFIDRRDR